MAPAAGKVFPGEDGVALATMDIFAGCGGLSEGFHQAGEFLFRCSFLFPDLFAPGAGGFLWGTVRAGATAAAASWPVAVQGNP
jgi:hypothetical protein